MTVYTVEIALEHPREEETTWDRYSTFNSYRDAIDQADMVHGRVIVGESGEGCVTNEEAHRWAIANQGYEGNYLSWCGQDDDEREEYEAGAAGISTS